MTVTGYPAPIKSELMERVVPLPEPVQTVPDTESKPVKTSGGTGGSGEQKKIPKYVHSLVGSEMSC